MNRIFSLIATFIVAPVLVAQSIQPGDVDWGRVGASSISTLQQWNPGDQLTTDDNFFISRVRPHERIRNVATQVDSLMPERRLLYWVPCGTLSSDTDPYGQSLPQIVLPNGSYDGDVFSMWPYVTHWGVWTAPWMRMPANLADVAHRNGVPVSCTAPIPNGGLSANWSRALTQLYEMDSLRLAQLFSWYGIDGIGYNSEFSSSQEKMDSINTFNERLHRSMHTLTDDGRERNPLFEIIWYDGCTSNGKIQYYNGLWTYNKPMFGDSAHHRTSFFINYNWNKQSLLDRSLEEATSMGRSTYDLYMGFNMQGAEPKLIVSTSKRWPWLQKYPQFSIGLWGAHSESMMWESRDELGASPQDCQRTYLLRQERWFTGGTRNPVSSPAISNSMRYDAHNYQFMGMSRLLYARSPLGWDVHEEPFITYFNLGNGTYFNYQGLRQHSQEWSNIGVQDLLPTWRFWFSTDWLGRDATTAQVGLDAEFTWADAYLGGSCLRLCAASLSESYHPTGEGESLLPAESSYLHLFKTDFSVTPDDLLTLRLKHRSGSARLSVVASLVGSEDQPFTLATIDLDTCSYTRWTTLQTPLPEGRLALLALRIEDATADLDLGLGELSLRPSSAMPTPQAPTGLSATLLRAGRHGIDAKLLWTMSNSVEPARVCYNLDVNTAYYKMYAQVGDADPVLMGITTSWAGIVYSCPASDSSQSVRFGVSAVSLDHQTESAITWSPMLPVGDVWQEEADDTVRPEELPAQYGCAPQILELQTEGEAIFTDEAPARLTLRYSGAPADGSVHAGVRLDEIGYGVLASDTLVGLAEPRSFSVEAWVRPDHYWKQTHLLSVRDKTDSWFANECGFFWHFIDAEGHSQQMAFRDEWGASVIVPVPDTFCVPAQRWSHLRYDFDYDAQANKWQLSLWLNDTLQCQSGRLASLYPWRPGNVISFGGHQYTHGGIDGIIDGFQLTVEGEPVIRQAQRFYYDSGEGEGVGVLTWMESEPAPGCPWITASEEELYCVVTEPQWDVPGAVIDHQSGSDEAGEAQVTFSRPGEYQARLTLRNGYGTSVRDYPLIVIDPLPEAIEQVTPSRSTSSTSCLYDLWGRRIQHPLPGQIYLRR